MTALPPINFEPQPIELRLYAGDGAALTLALLDEADQPIDLEGEVIAQVKLRREDVTALQEFAVVVDANQATLTLTGDQTAALGEFTGAWDVQWTLNGSQPVTLVQGKATCKLDVTR